MTDRTIHAVTGAFGYSGQYITRRLLADGCKVRTLTNSPERDNPFDDAIDVCPFHFDNPAALVESLRGVKVLYNTYWIRFNHRLFTQADAVRNTIAMFEAAKTAGVERVVHVSITNPSLESDLEYFKGKAVLEEALKKTGVSYAILRPAVLFGREDILINNIAWMLRRFPVFGVFGDGEYRLQPIHVDELARLAVEQGGERENVTVNAIGPETFTYRELVERIGEIIGKRRKMMNISPALGYWVGWLAGMFVGDVIITRPEIKGLMDGLLYVDTPPTGEIKLTQWASEHADTLGKRYTSEVARRKDRASKYRSN